jgi:phosphohistidine phosphatase
MTLLLVHHAQAMGPHLDSRRPLSSDGQATAERLAAAVAARGFVPELIWHSGKLRARQTAEALWLAGDHRAAIAAVRGLQPGDPPSWLRDQIGGETRSVALVGHMPHLPALFAALQRSSHALAGFPLHGCVGLEADGDAWREVWRFRAD